MPNMSYCRFENTARDLQDCLEHMEGKSIFETEKQARKRLILLCVELACDYGSEVGHACEEV